MQRVLFCGDLSDWGDVSIGACSSRVDLFYVHYFALYIAILANDLPTLSSEVFHFGLSCIYARMVMMPNYIIAIPM